LQYIFAGAILYFIFNFIELRELVEIFKSLKVINLIIIILLAIAIQYLHITRWGFILQKVDYTISWKIIRSSYFIGASAGFITPGQIGEFFARKINLNKISVLNVSLYTFIDKFYLITTTLFLGSISLLLFFPSFIPQDFNTIKIALIIISFGFPFLLVFSKSIIEFLNENNFIKIKILSKLFDSLRSFNLDKLEKIKLISNTSIIHFLLFLQFYFAFNSFIEISLLKVISGIALLLFLKSFIFFSGVGDLGFREGLAILIFSKFNIPAEISVSASLIIFSTNLLIPAFIGLILLLSNRYKTE
ncbi:MAG: lysylphosphatidylglycerol synthase transmembrane domain-containing protein, partial [Bacteroidetes bacterium]|nr:lysylphosphatidylglycerol synthase transmembrane domain-containing protein [Bacteroidota bacterium]